MTGESEPFRKFAFAAGTLEVSKPLTDEDQVFHGGLLSKIWADRGVDPSDRDWQSVRTGELYEDDGRAIVCFHSQDPASDLGRARCVVELEEWATKRGLTLKVR